MPNHGPECGRVCRRTFLADVGWGFTGLALGAMLQRDGVARGSEYHLTEYFGPILGIMTAATLDEAIDAVNEIDYGLTSGDEKLRQIAHQGGGRPLSPLR